MNNINVRAHEYGRKRAGGIYTGGTKGMIYSNSKDMYITIATEQKNIDIEDTIDWFKNNWRNYVDVDKDGMIRFGNWESDYRNSLKEDINEKNNEFFSE